MSVNKLMSTTRANELFYALLMYLLDVVKFHNSSSFIFCEVLIFIHILKEATHF